MTDIITVKQAAPIIGISIPGVVKHIQVKNLPAIKYGNTWLIKSTDLAEFIRARATGRFQRGWNRKTTQAQGGRS